MSKNILCCEFLRIKRARSSIQLFWKPKAQRRDGFQQCEWGTRSLEKLILKSNT